MPYDTAIAAAYGHHVTLRNARRVWAAVTAHPQATVRELGGELGMPFGTVAAALRLLRDAGYVEFDAASARARRVLIPFIVIGKGN